MYTLSVFSEKSFFKKSLRYESKYAMGSHAIALNFSKKSDSTDWLFHTGFEEIRFLKWRDVINSDSCFLAILKGFSEGLPLFKLIFFFLKLKRILTKIDISWVKSSSGC